MPIPKKNKTELRKSAKNIVYDTLCDWIISGELLPGEKLSDTELAAYFEVSRTPVREALQMLENQNLIVVLPGRATIVSEIHRSDIEKCYLPLAEIQALAVKIATPKLTDNDISELEKTQQQFFDACTSGYMDGITQCDERFHDIILNVADNKYMTSFSHILSLHIKRIRYHYFHYEAWRKQSAAQHHEILNALKSRNAEQASELMRAHWLYVMNCCKHGIETQKE
ncbi:MAG: GntR family transcriptional regulator [Eubacteriales bacterium]|nr:GntR family transcriptional regulator [Eubacteriales bacterium]